MALNPYSTQRGAVGGVVHQNGRFGPITRLRVTPINPNTEAQQNQRNILGTVAAQWRALTIEQMLAWNAMAVILGSLTGFNLYTKVNATRITCGQAVVTDPPAQPAFGVLTCAELTASPDEIVAVDVADTLAPDKFMVYATPSYSPGKTSVDSQYRLVSVVAGHDVAADIDISADYIAKFGAPTVGKRVSVKIIPVKNGFHGVAITRVGNVVA